MKRQSTTLLTLLSKEAIATLTKVVNETVASGYQPAGKKIFSAADLWNIQKQRRSFVQRRFGL